MADHDTPVEVELTIAARPETVFRHFTDPARFARWMGEAAVLEPRAGGRLRVGYPTGQVAGGYAASSDQLAPVLAERVADWLAAWNEPDPAARSAGRPSGRARRSWPPAPTWPGPIWTAGSGG